MEKHLKLKNSIEEIISNGVFNGEEVDITSEKMYKLFEAKYNDLREVVKEVETIKNPYSQEKQYQQWAAVENVLDIIIRSKKRQKALENTNNKN